MSDDYRPVNIMKASRLLQAQLGTGSIDVTKIEKGQKIIESNKVDFIPLAQKILDEMDAALAKARVYQPEARPMPLLEQIGACVMQLKGNGAMFGYSLISDLAGIVLNFIESIKKLDDDALDICEAHHMTIKHLIGSRIKGDGGELGVKLREELNDAFRRYFARYAGGEAFMAKHVTNKVNAFEAVIKPEAAETEAVASDGSDAS